MWLVATLKYYAEQPNEIPLHSSSRKLLSEQRMMDGIQFGLHKDQRKRDIHHWWSTWLALVQISFADMPRGPRDPSRMPEHNITTPANQGESDMCHNQVSLGFLTVSKYMSSIVASLPHHGRQIRVAVYVF